MKYHVCENEFGEPIAHVEVSAPEVQTIFSALCSAAYEHRQRIEKSVKDGEDVHTRAFEAIAEFGGTVALWNALDDELSEVWWPWINSFDVGEVADID